MSSETHRNGDEKRTSIGPTIRRDDTAVDMGRLANREADPMPSVLYLENARLGGEITILRNRLSELRDIVAEAGGDETVLSMEDWVQFRVLGQHFARGSTSTSEESANVPKRYLPKRAAGEEKSVFTDRQAEARNAVKAAYRAAFEFIRAPGITAEGAAEVQADVERRRDVFDREIREAGGVPEGDLPATPQE